MIYCKEDGPSAKRAANNQLKEIKERFTWEEGQEKGRDG